MELKMALILQQRPLVLCEHYNSCASSRGLGEVLAKAVTFARAARGSAQILVIGVGEEEVDDLKAYLNKRLSVLQVKGEELSATVEHIEENEYKLTVTSD